MAPSDQNVLPPSSVEAQVGEHVGKQFGNYRLVRLIGQGGFAEVYLGEHLLLDTQAAIKVLYAKLARDDIETFRLEARTIARLLHPHIVRVLDFGVEGTTPFLVMDYAPGDTIRRLYPKGTRLPLETVVSYVKQVATALQYAHEQKVIHRDVKPENMLMGRNGEVLLSDFGIALITQSSRYEGSIDMAGTIAYMAPEQIEAHPRPASDQYSLGIVVYEWLTGDRPFHGSFREIAIKHSLVPPPSLCEQVSTLPPAVEQVVLIALAKDPKQRFGSVLAFATALEQASTVKLPEPGPVVSVSETIDANQSPQPAMASPVIPFSTQAIAGELQADTLSQQVDGEVSADIAAQPPTIIPLSGKEHLPQVEEERRKAEEERTGHEQEQTDIIEEEWKERVRRMREREMAARKFASSVHQTPLPTEEAHSSKPPALRPNAMVAVKPAKSGTSRRFGLLVLAGLVIVALAGGIVWYTVLHASPAGSITEFPIPTPNNMPEPIWITAGPDGNLWFTEFSVKSAADQGMSKIGRISPSGTITEFPLPTTSSYPWEITSGPDGNLWFTENGGNKIGRISPSGTITEYPVPTAQSQPWGITAGPDGNLWFTEYLVNKIGRISPIGTIIEFPLPTAQSAPFGITAGPDGNLWFTELAGTKIGRISPSGSITEFPIPTASSYPFGITAGPDGNLWFTEWKGNKIGRISPSGSITEFPVPTASSYPWGITAGPDGNLWFTEEGGNKIGRINSSGSITEFPVPTASSYPWGITAGPDSNLWFIERTGNKIGRITSGK